MSFDAREATVASVRHALVSGQACCRDVVQAFLARIEAHNPTINAILSLNPDVLHEADELDQKLATGQGSGMLFGVPILLKDNFDAVGMPTTAGSLALRDAWPEKDASSVAALRTAGALILGKTNLHEFALEGLTVSSLGGQTLNPYDFTRTPGGSSGGSGAAIAASFAVMATGTDTVNSLRSPASANGLYSFRPTPGLISRKGVVPCGSTQDTIGMIGRSLYDIAIALTVMSSPGSDKTDNATSPVAENVKAIDYTQNLASGTSTQLKPFRIGVLAGFFDHNPSPETDPVNHAMCNVISLLRASGTIIIDIVDTKTFHSPAILSTTDVQMYEIRSEMDKYLSTLSRKGTHPTTFTEIFTNPTPDPNFLVIPSQYSYIDTALTSTIDHPDYATRKSSISTLTRALYSAFETHNLDALIYPQQRNLVVPIGSPSQSGRNGILAAVTGSPVICIPAGYSPPTNTAPTGLPIGMEVLGLPRTEVKLLGIARGIDEMLNARKSPVIEGLDQEVEVKRPYNSVPVVEPLGLSNVDIATYPPGRF